MGLFKGKSQVNDAKVSGGGVYLTAGEYVLEIEATKAVQTRKDGLMFVADLIVRESDSPTHKVGSRVNYCIKTNNDWGFGNIKVFLIAASGLSPNKAQDAEEINGTDWDEALDIATTNTDLFKGLLVRARAVDKANKAGDVRTRQYYTAHEGTKDAIAKRELAASKK
jgi:hypothetical protein